MAYSEAMSHRSKAKKGKLTHPGATSPEIVSRGHKRWRGKSAKCLRCEGAIRTGDMAISLPEHGGWMHDNCPKAAKSGVQCTAITNSGQRCRSSAATGRAYCGPHLDRERRKNPKRAKPGEKTGNHTNTGGGAKGGRGSAAGNAKRTTKPTRK